MNRTPFIALAIAVVAAGAVGGTSLATPASGVTSQTIGVGRFENIDAKALTDIDPGLATSFWQARINTKGVSQLYLVQNTIAPGGTFGWHGHPGPSLIIVKSGTATYYLAGDPSCRPVTVGAGSGFVDEGSGHLVRNEGTIDLVTLVVAFVADGFTRRIDQPAPAGCPGLL